MEEELLGTFSNYFEQPLIDEIVEVGKIVEVPAGETIMDIGQYIRSIPLLLSGAIKVLREDEEGDELLLYYLEQGETCSMTMACCMGQTKSEIRAITETDTKIMMVPVQKMEEWMGKYKGWRNYVFDSYHNRLNELLQTVDNIAFKNLDQRLVDYLKKKVEVTNDDKIRSTHQEIAYDLHTSRVVVSRLLKKLEKMKKVKLHRSYIHVTDL
ncbi:Crp/Fnr family transcriptional regulator [Flagellimonas zhangzhouensis]|uniref:CRP/FNR family transcriptional regulator, anaerobic regulatory protein n=1 Tax=Flagellimonas zhangzhouensis TaxID=1073328 RepID=A0A1H2U8J3_9FLAO|nr:Crp/Fnr family transcriptional regulator [Allomuricauda zhangzhouensis]SDQ19361.1 CRP/FNR family transcriptional regulator, anaerobic regulatory protein [Allomuricauda zhangzhouensis]SDW52257.1 CRP/FNR family transcriptional regulator, anaerobic regulatory protein [Allomuricauda zhangzhouensis]